MFKALDNSKIAALCWYLGVLVLFSGCALHKTQLPEVIKVNPSLDEVITAVNNNSSKISSLFSDDGTLGVSSSPWTARCRLAYRRDSDIRLVGNLNMVGPVVDVGSNGDIFWFWFKYQGPDQISYCKLSDYAQTSIREQIPVDPIWFPESLGVIKINPTDVVEGPIIENDNTVKLVLKRTRPEGDYLEHLFLESKTAALRRLEIRNPVTNEYLTVSSTESQFDSEYNVVLPKKITISRSSENERVYIDLGTLRVNSPNQPLVFSPPDPDELGVPLVDIGPNARNQNASIPQDSVSNNRITVNLTSDSEDVPRPLNDVTVSGQGGSEDISWGTGNAVYRNQSLGYSTVPMVSAYTRNEHKISEIKSSEIPSASSDLPKSISSSSNGATARLETVVFPESNDRQFLRD